MSQSIYRALRLQAVSEALEKAAKGRTCITIAHRLTTVKDSDLICVLDKGKNYDLTENELKL